ncbi:MAG: hypothetical protein AAGF92_03320, partial [Myxococcota bacterium]
MRNRRLVTALLCLATACGDGAGGDTGGTGGTAGAGGGVPPVIVAGAVEGCVETQGGSVGFVRTAEDVTGTAVADASVTVTGVSQTTTTGPDGCFRLEGVPAGLAALEVEGASPVPLTVIGEATINVGATPIPRSDAVLAAERALADRGFPTSRGTWILATQQPLPAGVTVDDALVRIGADDGTPSLLTVGRPSWFVFVDPFAGAFFAHPTLFVLVDADTGAATSLDVSAWPHLNGLVYYAVQEKNASSPDAVMVPPPGARPALQPELPALKGAGEGQVLGLIIQGDGRDDFAIDRESWTKAIEEAGGFSLSYTPPTEAEGKVIDGKRDIVGLLETLNEESGPEDTLVVAINTHGERDGRMKLEQGFPKDGADPSKVNYTIDEIPWDTIKANSIVVVVDTCHAEAVAKPLETLFRGDAFKDKQITVIAGTCANEVGGAEGRDSPFRPGGYVTNAVLDQLAGDYSAQTAAAKFNDIAEQAKRTSSEAEHWGDALLWQTDPTKGLGVNPKLLQFNIPGDCSDPDQKVSSALGVGDNLELDGVAENVDYRVSVAPTLGSSAIMGTMVPSGSALSCGNAAFATSFGPDITGPQFNDSTYPCGVGEEALTLCQNPSPIPDGDYIVVFNVLADDVVLEDPTNFWVYGFVFDADGNPANNFQPLPEFPNDFFQDTDRWYQAQYAPGAGWSLRVTDATIDPGGSIPSQARLIIVDNTLVLVVPRSEF